MISTGLSHLLRSLNDAFILEIGSKQFCFIPIVLSADMQINFWHYGDLPMRGYSILIFTMIISNFI